MPSPTSRFFVSQRLKLHYVDWGNAAAPPLVLVHGGRDHCRNWDWVAQHLAPRFHVVAPDLRGHGDSQWNANESYRMEDYVYDLAQLIHQLQVAPVTLVGHSLGGNICIRAAAILPEMVTKLVAIEGLGFSPKIVAERAAVPVHERLAKWIAEQRGLAGRSPRRYGSLDEALARMREANPRLAEAQARHLTEHGVNQNEDGTLSWKFDPYLYSWPPVDLPQDQIEGLWQRIACPTLLVYGAQSWASNPATDGRARHLPAAEVVSIDGAGHWVHHDRLEAFLAHLDRFI